MSKLRIFDKINVHLSFSVAFPTPIQKAVNSNPPQALKKSRLRKHTCIDRRAIYMFKLP